MGFVQGRAATIPLVSALTGRVEDGDLSSAAGQVARLSAPVQFAGAMATLAELDTSIWVEVSPHPSLLGAARRAVDPRARSFLGTLRIERAWETFAESVAAAWVRGASIDPDRMAALVGGRRVALPFLPYERVRAWIERPEPSAGRR